jgi:peptidyl-tRNA hydrolase
LSLEQEFLAMVLTMYIILRKDLLKLAGWTNGSVIAQASHGVSKAIWKYRGHEAMVQYLEDIEHMHKVVLEMKNLSQLMSLSEQLRDLNFEFVEWVEQPENTLTCIILSLGLVTRPYEPEEIRPFLKKCALYKQ